MLAGGVHQFCTDESRDAAIQGTVCVERGDTGSHHAYCDWGLIIRIPGAVQKQRRDGLQVRSRGRAVHGWQLFDSRCMGQHHAVHAPVEAAQRDERRTWLAGRRRGRDRASVHRRHGLAHRQELVLDGRLALRESRIRRARVIRIPGGAFRRQAKRERERHALPKRGGLCQNHDHVPRHRRNLRLGRRANRGRRIVDICHAEHDCRWPTWMVHQVTHCGNPRRHDQDAKIRQRQHGRRGREGKLKNLGHDCDSQGSRP